MSEAQAQGRGLRPGDLLDPFFLAIALTLVVVAAGLVATGGDGAAVLNGWLGGFSSLFAFAMQMILMLALGHAVATAPMVLSRIEALAEWIANRRAPAFWVTVLTAAFAWVHWGLGLVAGGLIARAAAAHAAGDRAAAVRYTAAAYGGFLVWHGGLSGSAPLVVATPGHFLSEYIDVVPIAATLFSPLNLVLVAVVVLAVAVAAARVRVAAAAGGEVAAAPAVHAAGGSWVGPILGGALVVAAAAAWAAELTTINLNWVILVLFAVALMLQGHPDEFGKAVRDGLGGTAGIAIQFPLYGAIMGVMRESGLVVAIADALTRGVPEWAFTTAVFGAAGLINLAVPSGGGQWAVQGPIMIQAAQGLGVSVPATIVAFAWGDAWTNLIQPFWALPLLALTGARAQDVLRVTWKLFAVAGVCVVGVLLVAGVLA